MFVSSRDVSPLGCLFGCAPRRGAEGEGECRWDIVYGAIAIPRPGSRAPLQLRAFAFSPRRRAHSRSPCRGGESCGVSAAPPEWAGSDEVATSPRLHAVGAFLATLRYAPDASNPMDCAHPPNPEARYC